MTSALLEIRTAADRFRWWHQREPTDVTLPWSLHDEVVKLIEAPRFLMYPPGARPSWPRRALYRDVKLYGMRLHLRPDALVSVA